MATRFTAIALTAAALTLAGCGKSSPFVGTWNGTFAFDDPSMETPANMPDFTIELGQGGAALVTWEEAAGAREVTGTWSKAGGKTIAFDWTDAAEGDVPTGGRLDDAGNLVLPFVPAEGLNMSGTFTKAADPEPAAEETHEGDAEADSHDEDSDPDA